MTMTKPSGNGLRNIDIQRLLLGQITPDDIRKGNDLDWRFMGDYNPSLYTPQLQTDGFVDEWEAKVALILSKHMRGMWIVDGPRGSGKTLLSVTCAFYYRELFGRPVACNFPLKPAFGPYRLYNLNDIRDQLDRLRALPEKAGTADWKAVNLDKYGIWLPRHIIIDDELHKTADKRRPGTHEMKLLSDLINEIRHYDIVWIGITPDRDILDAHRINNPMFMSTEVKCWTEVDPITHRQYVWGHFYANEGANFQRIISLPDAIRFDVARFCNLYHTQAVGSAAAKLTRPSGPGRRAKSNNDDFDDI